jgi:hypothetical protein
MFDLEQAILQWRQALGSALGGRTETVEELEDHLRQEVQRFLGLGQTPERAWEAALQRLGTPQQLAAEFAKLPRARPPAWLPALLVQLALGCLGIWLAWMLMGKLVHGMMEPVLAGHLFAVTIGYAALFGVGVLGAWSLCVRAVRGWDTGHGQALRSVTRRLSGAGLALTAGGVLLGAWWARDHLGRFWAWDWREIGGLGMLAWFLVMLLTTRGRQASGPAVMLLAVCGNVVAALCSFGPALVEARHSYGLSGSLGLWLAGFILSQLVILLLGLTPTGWLARRRT